LALLVFRALEFSDGKTESAKICGCFQIVYNMSVSEKSFYSLSNIADFNRAAKGLSGVPTVYNQSTRVNFGGFMLLRHNIQFVPPKNKKSFPFLRSFFICAGWNFQRKIKVNIQ